METSNRGGTFSCYALFVVPWCHTAFLFPQFLPILLLLVTQPEALLNHPICSTVLGLQTFYTYNWYEENERKEDTGISGSCCPHMEYTLEKAE